MLNQYPPEARRLLIANIITFVGFGMSLQYPLIYLNSARGITLNEAGAMLTFAGLLGLAISPLAGVLIDRYGARIVMLAANIITVFGSIAFAHVTTLALAAVVWVASTMAQSARFPAFSTLLGVRVNEEHRSSAYSLNYAGINFGIGLGGLLGGFLIDITNAATFQTVYYIQAAFTLLFTALTWQIHDDRKTLHAHTQSTPKQPSAPTENVWRGMLRNRPFVLLCLMNLLFWGNVSQQNSFLPLYATQDVGATPRELGYALGLNTIVIAVLQMPVMRWLRNISSRKALVLMYAGIVLGWGFMLLAGVLPKGQLPLFLVVITPGIIGLAETIFSPIVPPWALKVSPPEQIGRYNGVLFMVAGIAQNAGPFVSTLFVGANASATLLWLMIASCIGAMVIAWQLRD